MKAVSKRRRQHSPSCAARLIHNSILLKNPTKIARVPKLLIAGMGLEREIQVSSTVNSGLKRVFQQNLIQDLTPGGPTRSDPRGAGPRGFSPRVPRLNAANF